VASPNPGVRVTAAEVKEIFETLLPDSDVNAFINTAHLIVNEQLANQGMSEARLGEIEKYLAAHLTALKDPRLDSEKVGQYSYKAQGKTDLGLDATIYGQQVRLLDSSGILSEASEPRKRATIEVLSKD
jgi:hypothetical protein